MAKKSRTAAELLSELAANPQYQARRRGKHESLRRRAAEDREASVPVLEALNTVGIDVYSVWDLVNTDKPYPLAVPILLDHVQRPYPDRVREGIARALAVRESAPAWQRLRALFETEESNNVKWALGCALAVAAQAGHTSELLELVRDRRHGPSRASLLDAIAGNGGLKARATLFALRDDADLSRAARLVIKKYRIKP